MLRRAVELVVTDDSFRMPVEPATTALKAATCVHQWMLQGENETIAREFEEVITLKLRECFVGGDRDGQLFRLKRDELCRSYYQLRISEAFSTLWHAFLEQVGCTPLPIFYQTVTDHMFEDILISEYSLETANASVITENITSEDANVIRYVAGYVCRKVKTKIDKSSLSNKPSLDTCLCGLLGEGDAATATVEWIQLVDRGGLLHVREGTYMLFCAMEEVVREHLHANKVHNMTEGYKTTIVSAVKENEEVLFHWCMLTAESEDEDARVVFDLLIDVWITVRGFSFTSAWLELYKRDKKAGLQRSKALRKEIH